jgi:hypothetical protein
MAGKTKYKPFVLPSDFKELELYVQSHKTDLTERVISSIEFAIQKNLPMVEVFNFKNSDSPIFNKREVFFRKQLGNYSFSNLIRYFFYIFKIFIKPIIDTL